MEWLFNLIIKIDSFIRRETWWRKYYKRVVFTYDKSVKPAEKCNYCDAADAHWRSEKACNILAGRDCPCKSNQILIKK